MKEGKLFIKKVINNNVVLVTDEKDAEVVIMGKGLAFKARVGDELDSSKVDKIFTLQEKEDVFRFAQLLSEVPEEYFYLTEELVEYAIKRLEKKLNNSIYITLTDHINSMIERAKNNQYLKNSMLWDIKHLYRDEFNLCQEIIEIINTKMGTAFDDNEAASLAMHFANAETDLDMNTTLNITKVITEILNIVKYFFRIVYDEDSLSYYRFIVHLRFFAQRLFFGNTYKDGSGDELLDYFISKYPEAYRCALSIKKFIKDMYDYDLVDEECLYLTIHIAKVVSDSKPA